MSFGIITITQDRYKSAPPHTAQVGWERRILSAKQTLEDPPFQLPFQEPKLEVPTMYVRPIFQA